MLSEYLSPEGGKDMKDMSDENKLQEAIIHIQRIIEEDSHRYEIKYRRKDGDDIDVEVSVSYYSFPEMGGRFFAFIRNITDHFASIIPSIPGYFY